MTDLGERWRYQVGDDAGWSQADFADRTWPEGPLAELAEELRNRGGRQMAWWRRVVDLDRHRPSGPGVPGLALLVGGGRGDTFEIHVDGALVGAHVASWLNRGQERMVVVPWSRLQDAEKITVAVRYQSVGGQPVLAGRLLIGDVERLQALGDQERWRLLRRDVLAALLALCFISLAIYGFHGHFRRRLSIRYGWFACTASLIAAYIFLGSQWAFRLGATAVVASRLQNFVLHLGCAVFVQFLWPVLGRRIGHWMRLYQISHFLWAIFVLVVPSFLWVLLTHPWRWLWILPLLATMARLLIEDLPKGGSKAKIIALGGFIALTGSLVELIHQVLGLGSTFPLPAWCFVYFLLALAVSPLGRSREMDLEFEELRHQLERMVEDRTEELSAANERLKAEIMERQLAEGAMRMLERAVEQSIDGLLVADLSGSTQFVNESWARMHGYEVLDLLGHHLSLFHTPEQMRREVVPCLERVRKTGADQAEVEHRRKDGGTFPTLMSFTLLQDPEKGPEGFVIFARDITERRKTEEERLRLEAKVQQAQKLESLGVLAGGIAHDYNNLLTGVLGNASLALAELPSESSASEKIQHIERAAERAADLAGQLLAYAGQNQLFARQLQLNDLLSDMKPLFESAVAKNADLKLHLRDNLPPIDADPSHVRQVVLNLVTNASDAITDNQGVITIRTSKINASRAYLDGAFLDEDIPEGEYVLLGVSDTGIGMDQETRSKMFDPFFSAKASGRGLGLAAVLGIVRGHRGNIKVYSQPSRGTTVEILFPMFEEQIKPAIEEGASLRDWRGDGIILVVDDEQMVRGVSKDVLVDRGFEVLIATEGQAALDLYRQQRDIRLVLLDRTMPHTDVPQVFRQIRQINPTAKVILMSGYKEKEVMEDFGSEGLAGFLQKPFRPEELLSKVREVLESEVESTGR